MKQDKKTIVITAIGVGTVAFLFFGQRSLADIFYFSAGVVGIMAFVNTINRKNDLKDLRQSVGEKIEEMESRIGMLEQKKDADSNKSKRT